MIDHLPDGFRFRMARFFLRWRRPFWILHSIWALATGVVVIVLAHERYGFVPWVVGFLAFTWLSTLFFTRIAKDSPEGFAARFGHGFTSYLTRCMYQETLFFLLPFYVYSVIVPSFGLIFVGVLGVLAVLACLDLYFEDLMERRPSFRMVFFGTVTFAALNFLMPTLFGVPIEIATPLSAGLALLAAAPLTYTAEQLRRPTFWGKLAAGTAAVVAAAWLGSALIPPVPLRLRDVTFAQSVDRETVEPQQVFESSVTAAEAAGQLAVVVRIFSPTSLPVAVVLDWYHEGERVGSSREVEIEAHEVGFRVWDALRPAGGLAPGTYRVEVRTDGGRAFGKAEIEVL